MGTRCLTHVLDSHGNHAPLVTIYRQFDGYPDGHGQDLFDAFGATQIINGIGFNQELPAFANGMGCLAAALVSTLKTENGTLDIGGVYLQPPGTSDAGEEYTYTLYQQGSVHSDTPVTLMLKLVENHSPTFGGDKTLFDGPLSGYAEWLEKYLAEREAEES